MSETSDDAPCFERAETFIQYLQDSDGSKKEKPFNWPCDSGDASIDKDTDHKRVTTVVRGGLETRPLAVLFAPDAVMIYDNDSGELLSSVPASASSGPPQPCEYKELYSELKKICAELHSISDKQSSIINSFLAAFDPEEGSSCQEDEML